MNEFKSIQQETKFSFSIKTFGCKANTFDSLVLENELLNAGGIINNDNPEFTIINSCTVTNGADKQSSIEAKKVKSSNINTTTIFTGCMAEVNNNQSINHCDYIIGNQGKHSIKNYILKKKGIDLNSIDNPILDDNIYWGQLPSFHGKTRAFIKIQEGCNDFCTYCIIPYSRGKSRSVQLNKIVNEITRLVDENVQEIILTGINIADYGKDIGLSLEDAIEEILNSTRINRIRISSLDPTEITVRLLKLMKENSRIMPHLHVSLQSPISRVLRAMKRNYRQEEVVECFHKIYDTNPEIYVGIDLISGFPSETIQEHEDGLELMTRLPWTRLHVFPYSERKNTPALKIPGTVDIQERKRRSKEWMNYSLLRHKQISEKYISRNIQKVLFEKTLVHDNQSYALGHADNYHRVMMSIDNDQKEFRNTIYNVQIRSILAKPFEDWTLVGSQA